MNRLLVCFALLFSALVVTALGQQTTFRTSSESVPVFVTVTDKNDRLVGNLTRENFQIFDNGKAQPLTVFDNTPQPIRVIVLLDISGSMARNLPLLRRASEEFLSRLRPDDKARVGTFGNEITISPTFTRDLDALRAALPTEIPQDAQTPLWKAMYTAIGEFEGVDGRPVILVMSDGKDSQFRGLKDKFIGQVDVSERAQAREIMVYGIGVQSRPTAPQMGYPSGGPMGMPGGGLGAAMADSFPDPGLGTVALDTGGGYLELRPRDDIAAAFARVADELHSQYLLGFSPPARDGKRHKIEVKLNVRDMKPRARKTYEAPKE